MSLTTILALLQIVPALFAEAEQIKGTLGTEDLATLTAQLAAAKSAALGDVAAADAALSAASKL